MLFSSSSVLSLHQTTSQDYTIRQKPVVSSATHWSFSYIICGDDGHSFALSHRGILPSVTQTEDRPCVSHAIIWQWRNDLHCASWQSHLRTLPTMAHYHRTGKFLHDKRLSRSIPRAGPCVHLTVRWKSQSLVALRGGTEVPIMSLAFLQVLFLTLSSCWV